MSSRDAHAHVTMYQHCIVRSVPRSKVCQGRRCAEVEGVRCVCDACFVADPLVGSTTRFTAFRFAHIPQNALPLVPGTHTHTHTRTRRRCYINVCVYVQTYGFLPTAHLALLRALSTCMTTRQATHTLPVLLPCQRLQKVARARQTGTTTESMYFVNWMRCAKPFTMRKQTRTLTNTISNLCNARCKSSFGSTRNATTRMPRFVR